MAAGSTYTPIATTTLGSAQSSISFSSISGSYTDLILITTGACSAVGDVSIRFNSDSGSNYSFTYIYGNGSSALSGRGSNTTSGIAGGTDTSPVANICHIQNYSNTTTYKTSLSRSNRPTTGTMAFVNLWRNTSAINAITILADSGVTFSTGFTATLYGIAAA